MTNNSITAIPGIRVGHAHDEDAATGCTVILTEKGAVAGVDQRGGAPGTRETDALQPAHLVSKVHAVMLAGGSAFGLDAAGGAMRYLEERKVGFNVGVARVPIVPAAILFDLGIGSAKRRPDAEMGYQACQNASADEPAQGNAGAGMGATVGKLLGMGQAVKGGIGNALVDAGGGVKVGALIAVNSFGDVIDPASGEIVAGVRSMKKGPVKIGKGMFADSLQLMRTAAGRSVMGLAQGSNTVIGVVATNAQLDKEGATKVAAMASNGLARCLRPANTMLDGDTIFALSTGRKKADVSIVGAFAAEAVLQAVLNALQAARGLAGVPSLHDLR
ncbi:MAG: P1 family peptidase [Anaerolineales bacterium]|nr:MAG: P1 family peptidase [Anaerolineales bacterium]